MAVSLCLAILLYWSLLPKYLCCSNCGVAAATSAADAATDAAAAFYVASTAAASALLKLRLALYLCPVPHPSLLRVSFTSQFQTLGSSMSLLFSPYHHNLHKRYIPPFLNIYPTLPHNTISPQ